MKTSKEWGTLFYGSWSFQGPVLVGWCPIDLNDITMDIPPEICPMMTLEVLTKSISDFRQMFPWFSNPKRPLKFGSRPEFPMAIFRLWGWEMMGIWWVGDTWDTLDVDETYPLVN